MPDQMNPTQVSFGNFPGDVQARELADFLEQKVGLVLRCKVKKVVCGIVPPHAFVHFESPKAAKEAIKIAGKDRLILRTEWHLKARMDDRGWINGQRGLNCKVNSFIQLVNVMVELGSITGPTCMLVSWRGPEKDVIFRIEPSGRRLRFFFSQYVHLNGSREKTKCDIMMEIRLQEVREVQEVEGEVEPVLLLQLFSPPWIFYRTAEDDIYEYFPDPSQLAEDEDPWIRCLDIITPCKSIGRCLDYRLTVSPRQETAFMKVMDFFRSHGVLQKSRQAAYDRPFEAKFNPSDGSPFFSVPPQKGIPFDLMFLVNALVHHGIVHVSSFSSSFYRLLHITPVEISASALRNLLAYRRPLFEASVRLQEAITCAANESTIAKKAKFADGHMVVRRLIITPTRALCLPPGIEMSNRVIRHYRKLSDRFLRVSFKDESGESISSASLSMQVAQIVRDMSSTFVHARTALYRRIVSFMMDGLSLCGRHYVFLAFSAGQLRDASAWFFASDGNTKVNHIRDWMGTFPGGNVAKHAARQGQCFSATFSTLEVLSSERHDLPDIKRNNYDFSDGCGKISPAFAQLVAKSLKLEDNPPSAYQIRYAGYKGVVAVWPIAGSPGKNFKLALRESMKKFFSKHRQLEIVGWSKFLPCFLNRQIITLLSTLHVEDKAFMELQETMVLSLNRMMEDRDMAYSVLLMTSSGELYRTALRMLCAGFDPRTEAHLKAMLVAIRAGQLEELVQKTRIFVPEGRWLLGCLDETALLAYGQCFVRVSNPPRGSGQDKPSSRVIKGKVIMTKNPCMHPGDIRLLEAVDILELHHLVDCLVVPQNGPRPHPNEASGSDLDGDVYFVSWDENLFPPSGQSSDPMEYVAQPANSIQGPMAVKTKHVVEFFAKHMVNDSLGKICNAHVVHADKSLLGAADEKCLLLAELAAKAVDYPKTGKPAVMPYELKPKMYPDFMEKEKAITYPSSKIIGHLYRKVQGILPMDEAGLQLERGSSSTMQIPDPVYDPDLEVHGFEAYLEEAWRNKQSYDQQLRSIMSQFNIRDEGEVVTGHVRLEKSTSRKQGDVKKRVKYAYLGLLREFSSLLVCNEASREHALGEYLGNGTNERQQALASAWYHVTYHYDWYRKAQEVSNNQRPILSFPWVAVEHLVAIKNKVKLRT